MLGTAINVGAILAGTLVGTSVGSRLPEQIRDTVLNGLGLLTILIGLQMALETRNVLIVMGALLLGSLVGEALGISEKLDRLGDFLQAALSGGENSSISEGFVTASLVFCVGPMAIVGSIQDGLSGDYRLLAVKALLDGFASIAFSASLGWGVAFSAASILVYQGGITLFAGMLSRLLTDPMILEMTATGGLIIVGIGLKLLNIKDIRLANFLPSLVLAPLLVIAVPLVKSFF